MMNRRNCLTTWVLGILTALIVIACNPNPDGEQEQPKTIKFGVGPYFPTPNEGASHAAQAISVISEQVDIASDYNRNLDVLASQGRIDRDKVKMIWKSDPLPNDPIAIRGGLSQQVKQGLQSALVDLSSQQAQTLLPENYTGFVASDGSNYQPIQEAGELVGKLK